MRNNTKLSIAICSIVNDIVDGSHDTLNELFINAGAPGDPPGIAHHSKWKTWLKRASDDSDVDAYSVLGKIIEEFMEVEPVGYDLSTYHKNKKRLEDALTEDGLKYVKGGRIEVATQGFGVEALFQALKRRNFEALEIEFKRALDSVDNDPGIAITAACSILEALFTAYLELNLIELPNKKTVKPLWTMVQKHLGLEAKNQNDNDLQKILTGLSSIVDGVGAFRTHSGSAHGGGQLRYKAESRHARLTVNSAHTLASFVIETWERKYQQSK